MRSQASEKVCVLKTNCMQKFFEKIYRENYRFDQYTKTTVGLNYFLATIEYFSEIEGFDFEKALKLRPYGGIIDVDNSSVNKHLKISTVLRYFTRRRWFHIRNIKPKTWLLVYASLEK